MTDLLIFYGTHGIFLTGIAVIGVIVLGIMKYSIMFKNISESYRHYFYIGISIALSLIFGLIYLLINNTFEFTSYLLFAGSVFALNQTFYNIFKVTSLNDLLKKFLDYIFNHFKEK